MTVARTSHGPAVEHGPGQCDFPDKFLKGIALSVYQNSGDGGSNWTDFIKAKGYLGHPEQAAAFVRVADFWNMYEADIQAAASLGATSFRFSFEWARFQPDGPGTLDEATCTRYGRILDCIAAHGMEPMATLHHFVHPSWFEAAGGFCKDSNQHHFVAYSAAVFRRFGNRIRLWATFNEPTCFAFVGHIVGLWAPGRIGHLRLAGKVLCNLCKAHCAAYRALKQLPGGREACIGLVHQHIRFFPRHNLPHVRWLCKWMTFWFATDPLLKFFKTGVLEWDTPVRIGPPYVLHVDEGIVRGEKVTDWWGINYYSRPCVRWNFSMGASADEEPVADNGFRLFPQGMYDSIAEAGVLRVPIYLTEIGLADKDDKHRAWYIGELYAMLLRSIADGHDVRGAYWWTLMDNIEWHEGFHIRFGLYRWDPEFANKYADNNNRPPGGLQLREGGKALGQVHRAWPDGLTQLRAYAAAATQTGVVAAGAQAVPPLPPLPKQGASFSGGGAMGVHTSSGSASIPAVHGLRRLSAGSAGGYGGQKLRQLLHSMSGSGAHPGVVISPDEVALLHPAEDDDAGGLPAHGGVPDLLAYKRASNPGEAPRRASHPGLV